MRELFRKLFNGLFSSRVLWAKVYDEATQTEIEEIRDLLKDKFPNKNILVTTGIDSITII